jgi:hypothetical protein
MTPPTGRAATRNQATLDLLAAALDLRGLVLDRCHRAGGPRTTREAVDAVIDRAADIEALLAAQPRRR